MNKKKIFLMSIWCKPKLSHLFREVKLCLKKKKNIVKEKNLAGQVSARTMLYYNFGKTYVRSVRAHRLALLANLPRTVRHVCVRNGLFVTSTFKRWYYANFMQRREKLKERDENNRLNMFKSGQSDIEIWKIKGKY